MSTLKYVRTRKKKNEISADEFIIEPIALPAKPVKSAQDKLLEKIEADFKKISEVIQQALTAALDAHTHIAQIANDLREFLHEQVDEKTKAKVTSTLALLNHIKNSVPEEEETLKTAIEKYIKHVTKFIESKPERAPEITPSSMKLRAG
jgi:ABC-type transporter MlaC component